MDEAVHFDNRLEYDRLSFLYLSLPMMLTGQILGAFLLSAIEISVVDAETVGIWLLLNIVMFLYRFYHYQVFKKNSEAEKLREVTLWLHRYYTNVLISGVIWGSSAFLLFPENDLLYQMILFLFLFAIGFASMGVLATKRDLLLAYVTVMYGPILYQLFSHEQEGFYQMIGYAVMALVLIMLLIANYYGKVIDDSLQNRQYFVHLKASHEKLKERFFSLFERAPVGIYYYDKSMVLQDVNEAFLRMNGIENKTQLLGVALENSIEENKAIQAHKKTFKGTIGNYRGPYQLNDKGDENELYVDLSTVPMLNGQGEVAGGIAIVNDITGEVTAQEKMLRNAYYDILTDIPNRTLLMDKLKKLIRAKKMAKNYGALLFLDIDNFKKINNTFGHDIGDNVIKQCAYRLEEGIGGAETLARVGGDKFVVLIPVVGEEKEEAYQRAAEYVDRIHTLFEKPLMVAGKPYRLGFSIGVMLFSDTADTAFDLLKRAETAMYEAKNRTKGSMQFYEDRMSVLVREQLLLENDIHRAIEEDEFEMYYQPQLDVKSNTIIGAEALIRWNHPEKGMVMPNDFISLAEESGIIVKLEEWVFDRIFKDVNAMISRMGSFPLRHIAINVSTVHFLEPHFVEKLMLLVKKHKVDPAWFELEITESGIMRNIDDAIAKIKELKNFGFTFSIDDFGTGYSSLSHLKELPVDVIKIDQSFVREMNDDDEMIVEVVVAIGQKFNLEVLAEGVEKGETLSYLQDVKCNTYQGYLASTPIDLESFEALIEKK